MHAFHSCRATSFAVDAVVLLEPAKVQPVTAKLYSQTPDALIPRRAVQCIAIDLA